MKFLLKTISLFLFVILFSNAYSIEIPPKPNPERLVNDYAKILTSDQINTLEYKLRKYADSTSTQIVIVTVNSLNNESSMDVATEIGHQWGVGTAKDDNGVVILIAPNERKFAIATGYGANVKLTAGRVKRIENEFFKPYFKQQQYYEGLDLATTAIIQMLNGEFKKDNSPKGASPVTTIVLFFIIIFILFIISLINKSKSRTLGRKGGGSNGLLTSLFLADLFFNSRNNHRFNDFNSGGGDFGGFDGFGGGDFGGGGASGDW